MSTIEAEIYNNISDKMITDYNRPGSGRGPAAVHKQSSKDGIIPSGKVWDWGKFDVEKDSEESHTEIWEDEVGFLKTDLKNRCPQQK